MSENGAAIVTGGAQGLGAAICRMLLKQGYKVCIADIKAEKGIQFKEELQKIHGTENVIFSFCDVTKEDNFESTFDATLKAFGRIDVLINNAGISDENQPRKTIEVNLIGPVIGCQTAMKYMGKSKSGKGGIVVSIASLAGLRPLHTGPAYCASKHGVIGLTRAYGLPFHLKKNGIVFVAVCPGITTTNMIDKYAKKNVPLNPYDPEFNIGKFVQPQSPDHVAGGVLKVLQDRINGSILIVTEVKGYQYVSYPNEIEDMMRIEAEDSKYF